MYCIPGVVTIYYTMVTASGTTTDRSLAEQCSATLPCQWYTLSLTVYYTLYYNVPCYTLSVSWTSKRYINITFITYKTANQKYNINF